MTEASAIPQKYAPGHHPNSQANLQLFKAGEVAPVSPTTRSGPYLTPALKRLVETYSTMQELEDVDLHSLPPVEAIAAATIRDALTDAKARDTVFQRLDGDIDKGTRIEVGIMVRYVLDDQPPPA